MKKETTRSMEETTGKKLEAINSLSNAVQMLEKDKEILSRNLEIIILMQGENEHLHEVIELLTSIEFSIDENNLVIQIRAKENKKIKGEKRTSVYKLIDKLMLTLDTLEEDLLPIQIRKEFSRVSITEELRSDLKMFDIYYQNYLRYV